MKPCYCCLRFFWSLRSFCWFEGNSPLLLLCSRVTRSWRWDWSRRPFPAGYVCLGGALVSAYHRGAAFHGFDDGNGGSQAEISPWLRLWLCCWRRRRRSGSGARQPRCTGPAGSRTDRSCGEGSFRSNHSCERQLGSILRVSSNYDYEPTVSTTDMTPRIPARTKNVRYFLLSGNAPEIPDTELLESFPTNVPGRSVNLYEK